MWFQAVKQYSAILQTMLIDYKDGGGMRSGGGWEIDDRLSSNRNLKLMLTRLVGKEEFPRSPAGPVAEGREFRRK